MPRPSRRDILKSVAAGATTLTFAGTVSSANPDLNLNANQVERAIVRGAEKATGPKKEDVGAGVLNAAGAVEEAAENGTGNDK